jgi:hypothetical protein
MLDNIVAIPENFFILTCHFEFLLSVFEFIWGLVLGISDFWGWGSGWLGNDASIY